MKILRLDSRSDFIEIKRRNREDLEFFLYLFVLFLLLFLARTNGILGYK